MANRSLKVLPTALSLLVSFMSAIYDTRNDSRDVQLWIAVSCLGSGLSNAGHHFHNAGGHSVDVPVKLVSVNEVRSATLLLEKTSDFVAIFSAINRKSTMFHSFILMKADCYITF